MVEQILHGMVIQVVIGFQPGSTFRTFAAIENFARKTSERAPEFDRTLN